MKHNHSLFLIMAIFVTLFTSAVYGYMYYMVNVSLEKTVKAQALVNSTALLKERENNFLKTYEKMASKWSRVQGFFVESSKVVDFIESIELLSKQSGSRVTISSIDADNLDNAPSGKEGTVRLRVAAQGTWESVMKVLSLAEVLPYKVLVNNVQANVSNYDQSGRSTKSTKPIWDLSFDLQASMIAMVSTSTINTK